MYFWLLQITPRLMTAFVLQGHILINEIINNIQCCEKVFAPFLYFFYFLEFFAYLSQLKDSDRQTNLISHKDNPSKYKCSF